MTSYLIRRILLLPLTLFAIIMVNFVILNLVPGDPVTVVDRSSTGDLTRSAELQTTAEENQHLMFREHYGLTLPILVNTWWRTSDSQVKAALHSLVNDKQNMSVQDYYALRTRWGDRARFIMPTLLAEAQNPNNPRAMRQTAANLMVRGGTKQGYVGPTLNREEKAANREIATTNHKLATLRVLDRDSEIKLDEKVAQLAAWLDETHIEKTGWQKTKTILFETRFSRYLSRVFLLDFGTLRNDNNKTVISEVAKRIKYSLTLAVIPMFLTFGLCQLFGMIMAVKQNQLPDMLLNIFFLILFAVPIFVVAPFLIEKVALHNTVPFTNIPIPFSGFHSPENVYRYFTSTQKLGDISLHLLLPLIAVMYGTLAVQARLSRTAFLEVLRQDFIRTAHAKGLPLKTILIKHVGRNGAITIVTSLAASLGIILGGSLIVETVLRSMDLDVFSMKRFSTAITTLCSSLRLQDPCSHLSATSLPTSPTPCSTQESL